MLWASACRSSLLWLVCVGGGLAKWPVRVVDDCLKSGAFRWTSARRMAVRSKAKGAEAGCTGHVASVAGLWSCALKESVDRGRFSSPVGPRVPTGCRPSACAVGGHCEVGGQGPDDTKKARMAPVLTGRFGLSLEAHPAGVEPATFGSVDRRRRNANPMRVGELRQTQTADVPTVVPASPSAVLEPDCPADLGRIVAVWER